MEIVNVEDSVDVEDVDDDCSEASENNIDDVSMSSASEDSDDEADNESSDGSEFQFEADRAPSHDAPLQRGQPRRAPQCGMTGGRKSSARVMCQHPEAAAARREQRVAKKIQKELSLRGDIKMKILNRVILSLSKEERDELRQLAAMQQEHYVAKRSAVEFMQEHCFNALHAIDLRACEALPLRCMMAIRERLACTPDGQRIVIARPPQSAGRHNPLTYKSNKEQGIKYEHRGICMPYVFPDANGIAAAANRVLLGRQLHLAIDFDGAAWDLWDAMRDLLAQLERHQNLIELPQDQLLTFQFIFDGHGWSSTSGAVRFVLRCVNTARDHNSPFNSRDPIFFLGADKHQHLECAMKLGGVDSMRSRMYCGLSVSFRSAWELPKHVQDDLHFLPLACIGCANMLCMHLVFTFIHSCFRGTYRFCIIFCSLVSVLFPIF